MTGAGRGIGLALATALSEAGAETVLAARTRSEVEDAAMALRDRGGKAVAFVLDVTDISGTRELIAKQPAFDIAVINAGTNRPKLMVEVTEEDYDVVLDLNVRAAYFSAQAVVRKMLAERIRGSIIFTTSQMGHVAMAARTLYCASKHAVEGLVKAMAVELAPQGIRVNSIAPTFIETPMTAPYFESEAFRNEVLSKIKLGRLGRVEDLMGAVVFLGSDAAALMTGTSIKVDGGWTAE
ncbi:NAD(P)-dependent dehydrogenase (short-subunit alcohol dehydrogenase family) [Mesorhizobium robiniae]|uniref:NAD(P)-dependent dehydrogenase (Short-subunit alcohol dehydrogenase family) n=1 Tax=Mesorhizobium robiniae TaxID=559315 RepID=A0ABV2GNC9_9HYPH